MPTGIPLDQMREHVRLGHGRALLDSSAPPVLLNGQWWTLSASVRPEQYLPVRDPQVLAVLKDAAARMGAAQAAAGDRG